MLSCSTAPAYTTVDARRTFGSPSIPPPPPPPEPVAQPAPRQTKSEWSTAVRDYVQRSVAEDNAIPGITSSEILARLRTIIQSIAERDAINQVDWETMPLPQQIIQNERWQSASISSTNLREQNTLSMVQPDQRLNSTNKALSAKRKSSEISNDSKSVPPWRQSPSKNVFADRITRDEHVSAPPLTKKEKKQRKFREEAFPSDPSKFSADLEKRRHRFEATLALHIDTPSRTSEASSGPVVGTCHVLEKNYFRLTSAPKAETVRPLVVLQRAFDLVMEKWVREHNYSYFCDQFKSIRQDLTVQHIQNEFTVKVYETHARVALEKADMGEYNQCQTQLRNLYSKHLGGHPAEFVAYRILYFVYTANRSGMNDVLAQLTAADRTHADVKHALEVRASLAFGNYYRFFQLYHSAPNMGGWLMDRFVERERLAAMAQICKS